MRCSRNNKYVLNNRIFEKDPWNEIIQIEEFVDGLAHVNEKKSWLTVWMNKIGKQNSIWMFLHLTENRLELIESQAINHKNKLDPTK